MISGMTGVRTGHIPLFSMLQGGGDLRTVSCSALFVPAPYCLSACSFSLLHQLHSI